MSANPFSADGEIRDRIARLSQSAGAAIAAEVAGSFGKPGPVAGDNLGSVIPADSVARMIADHGLSGPEDLMLLALPAVQTFARPPISNFYVGSVGLEAETGNLVLGVNVEFPGSHLGTTVHGEGFVFTRSFSRGTTIGTIAIGEAHPCAHCRQYLSEFDGVRDLTLIDPRGHRLRMGDLYPWPFDPAALGEKGAIGSAVSFPSLAQTAGASVDAGITASLLEAGKRAHTPYSKCPGAVALIMDDGAVFTGRAVESVAFNPTMGPLQATLIDVIAHGYSYDRIAAAVLGTVVGGAVDYSRSTAELLAAVAPNARLTVIGWRP